ncbi:MAG: hypothetical protein ACLFPA_05270 [Dichotomicrobium sp.]
MKMFRRAIVGLGAVLIVLLALSALAPYLVEGDTVRDQLVAKLSAWAEGDLRVEGEVNLTSVFDLRIDAADVEIRAPERFPNVERLRADIIKARLSVWDLLNGRIVFGKVWVDGPVVTLRQPPDGVKRRSLWENVLLNEAPAFDHVVEAVRRAPFFEIELNNGTVELPGSENAGPFGLDEFSALIQRETDPPLIRADGHVIWNGRQVDVALERGPFQPAGPTREARLRVSAANPEIGRVAVDGRIVRANGARFIGDLDVDDGNLARLAEWLDIPVGGAFAGATYATSAELQATRERISLQGLAFEAGDTRATGLLGLELQGDKPMLSGTLGLSRVNLRGLTLNGPRNGVFAARDPMALRHGVAPVQARRLGRWLHGFNADLRVSAESIVAGGTTTGETAAFLSVGDGRATVNVAELMVSGGLVSGQFSVGWRDGNFRISGKGQAGRVNLESVLRHVTDEPLATGRADISFSVTGTGPTLDALGRDVRLAGELSAFQGGELMLDIARLAASGRARQASSGERFPAATRMVTQRGGYDMLTSRFRLKGRDLHLDMLEIVQDGWMIRGQGRADLASQLMEWRFNAHRVAASARAQASLRSVPGAPPAAGEAIGLHLRGPWRYPHVMFERPPPPGRASGRRAGWP